MTSHHPRLASAAGKSAGGRRRHLHHLTVGIIVVGLGLARRRALQWGASPHETRQVLPGDELLTTSNLTATRAITIRAATEDVWPWIAQLGHGRGGFYSYAFLENLIGCDLHNAERVVAEWQDIDVDDEVKLHPEVGLRVADVKPGRYLVLRGAVPLGSAPAPYDFTWAFVVLDDPAGGTRLIVRERYQCSRWWTSALVQPVGIISAVMSQRMLRGIKERAEYRARYGAARH